MNNLRFVLHLLLQVLCFHYLTSNSAKSNCFSFLCWAKNFHRQFHLYFFVWLNTAVYRPFRIWIVYSLSFIGEDSDTIKFICTFVLWLHSAISGQFIAIYRLVLKIKDVLPVGWIDYAHICKFAAIFQVTAYRRNIPTNGYYRS